jgi:peptidyl-prolyl cis-trans isomerase B (cyclophilin B)
MKNRQSQFAFFAASLLLGGLMLSVGIARADDAPAAPATQPAARKTYDAPPAMTIDVNKTYVATFDTAKGKIVCELYAKDAPNTVNNFVFLARDHFYDGLTFHRVIADFMDQGGDPAGDGTGGPGYTFDDEIQNNPRQFDVGTLAMANRGPNTNGSQFFITRVVTDWLNGKHTIFGHVTDGQDVVNNIAQGDVINTVTITEK